ARWDYVVNGVQKASTAGSARAHGEYYIVRIALTNKGSEGLRTPPADFTLVDANGNEYRAESAGSGPYQWEGNSGSPFIWTQSFPVGRAVTASIVFDVQPSLPRGMLLRVS